MGRIDIICGLVTGAISMLFFAGTLSFPKSSIGIDPRAYPLFVIFATFALSIALIVQGVMKTIRSKEPSGKTLPRGKTALRLLGLAAGMLVYVFILEPAGFVIATPFLVALTMVLFEEKKPVKIALVSILTTVILYLVFRTVFRVPLPRSAIW